MRTGSHWVGFVSPTLVLNSSFGVTHKRRLFLLLLLSSSSAHRGPGSPLSLTELALTIKFQMSSEHQGLWDAERVSSPSADAQSYISEGR